MWTTVLLSASLAVAAPMDTAATATMWTGVALDGTATGLMFVAAASDGFGAIVPASMGIGGYVLGSTVRNTSIGLSMLRARKIGASRSYGWGAVGGTVAAPVVFWGLPTLGSSRQADTEFFAWWAAAGAVVRGGTYACLGLQNRENRRHASEHRALDLQLQLGTDRVVVAGRF